jgi:glycosyltransferase involved in cell wall biosynthesis
VGKDVPDITTGNSSTWQMMQQLFSVEAKPNVHYLGSISYQEIQTHIEKATVCVFPSFAEALPVSWIEGMAMEKAIVASNIGWAKEVIDSGINGFLVNPTAHSEYADRILELLENEDLQKEFRSAARKKVIAKFSTAIVAQQSLIFYQSLISKF